MLETSSVSMYKNMNFMIYMKKIICGNCNGQIAASTHVLWNDALVVSLGITSHARDRAIVATCFHASFSYTFECNMLR